MKYFKNPSGFTLISIRFAQAVRGFTLIELLVVITVVGGLGLVLSDFLVQTLRNDNKVRIVGEVKQNGEVVLNQLVSRVRQAEKVVCESNTIHNTIVLFTTDTYTRIRYYPQDNGSQPKNGYIALDEWVGLAKVGGTLNEDYSLSCQEAQIESDKVYLTNIDPLNGVSVIPIENQTKIFFRSQKAGYPDTMEVKFKVIPGVSVGQGGQDVRTEQGGVYFGTAAQLRGGKL
ncbi:MAG: type II secretion system protein [Candidatus Daviesbacteria bacterium]|nr:type II secretion system protein [Candidatus Daviesbacteria bacterium]